MLIVGVHVHDSHAQEGASAGFFSSLADTFDGYWKNSTAVELDDPDRFVKIQNSLELTYSNWFGDHARLTLVGRAVYDGAYDVEDGLDPDDEEDYRLYADLREAVLDLTFGDLDLHLGRQQVVWGKTDGFRVTDVVNPLDLRDRASTEFLDQRIPLWMGNLEYYFSSDFALQALIIPDLRFNKLPAFEFPEDVTLNAPKEPEASLEDTEYGLKCTGFSRGWDFTLNYLYSWDDSPALKRSLSETDDTLIVSPEHERLHIIGGTLANVFWDAVIRGELAAKIGQYLSVSDPTVTDMVVQKNVLNYAMAFERDLFDIHWIGQALQTTILDYDSSLIADEVSTYMTLSGSKDFLRETLEFSAFTIYAANSGQWTFQPAVDYDYSDALTLTAGVDMTAGGDEESNDDEQIYVELKYSF